MKKIFSILITLSLIVTSLLGLTACNGDEIVTLNGKTAEEVYTETVEEIETYKNNFTVEVNYDVDAKITVSEQEIPYSMKLYSTSKANGTNIYAGAVMDLGSITLPEIGEMNFGSSNTECYFVDDVFYMNYAVNVNGLCDDDKYKANVSLEKFYSQIGQTEEEIYNPIYDFSEANFNNIKFVKDGEKYYFELVLSGESAKEYTNSVLTNMGQEGASNLKYGDVSYKFFLSSEGKFDHAEIDFKVELNKAIGIMSGAFEFSYKGSIYFKDIGTTVVNAPADADDYRLITLPSLT